MLGAKNWDLAPKVLKRA